MLGKGKAKTRLYTVRKNVKCVKCENKGAVQNYGGYYSEGVGDLADKIKSYEKVRNKPYMSHAMGFGGTIPYECLNCGNIGLIDYGGLEGYKQAFITLADGDYCVELARNILRLYETKENVESVRRFYSKAKVFTLYEDDLIEIQSAKDTKAMSIEIKQPHHHPVIYVNDQGDFIRCHEDKHYFLTHAKTLLGIKSTDDE